MTKPHRSMTVRPWVLTLISVTVLVVWAVNILAGLVVDSWEPVGLNAVMLAIIALIGTAYGKSWPGRSGPAITHIDSLTPKEDGDGEP